MRRMVLVSLILLCVAAVPALAQQPAGNIAGRATAEPNAAPPGASVSAGEAATGCGRTHTTDGEGQYRRMPLQARP